MVAKNDNIMEHFASLSEDKDVVEEDILASALGVIGYSAQTLRLHPEMIQHIEKYLRSERLRLHKVSQETRYPFSARRGRV